MTLLPVLLLPFAAGAALATFTLWPIAHRAGKRAEQRDQAEIARILGGYDAPPVVRAPIEWRRPTPAPVVAALTAPTASHASLRVSDPEPGYQGQHRGAFGVLLRAHARATEDTYIGRPRELVA